MPRAHAPPARPLALAACLLSLLASAGCEVDLTEPRGTLGALGVARFTHSLEGDLGPTPIAVGAVFAMSANSDGCDRLATSCEEAGALAVVPADPRRLRVTPRADGNYGAEGLAAGSTTLFAVNARDEVVDFLDIQVASPAAVALTDALRDARRPHALPFDFGVNAGQDVDLRAAFVDRDGRVLLSGNVDFAVDVELRDVDPDFAAPRMFGPEDSTFDRNLRLRAPDEETSFRIVLYADDRSVDSTVYRVDVVVPSATPRLRLELQHVDSRPGFDVVAVDLCAVREQAGGSRDGSLFMLGQGYSWQAPWGFAIADKGLGPFANDDSRCVRAVRFDDREVPAGDNFFVTYGEVTTSLPYGVAMGQVRRPKAWWAPAWETVTAPLLPPSD